MDKQPRIHALLDSMGSIFTRTIDTSDPDELLHFILSEAIKLTQSQAGSILLYDKKCDELYFKYSIGGSAESLSKLRLPRGKGLGWQAILKNRILKYDDVHRSPYYYKEIEKVTDYRTNNMILAPLSHQAHLFGVIELINKGNPSQPFTQVDCRILDLFSQYASIALKLTDYKQEVLQKERWAAIGYATSGVAHYIKNILTSIQGSDEMLEMSLKNNNLEEGRYNWQLLHKNIEKLARFSLNLLRYSSRKTPHMELRNINHFLKTFIADFQESYRDSIPLHFYLKLEPQIPPFYFDRAILTDVFYNLFLNSIEAFAFKPEELKIRIQTTYNKNTGTVFIEYEDNGPGFNKEDKENLFTPFKKLSPGQGYGLGLTTIKLNLEQHGGQFWLDESRKAFDRGVLFVITMPLSSHLPEKMKNQ